MSDVNARWSVGTQPASTRRDLAGGHRRSGASRRLAIGVVAAVVSLAASLGGANAAWAAAQVSITPQFPVSVSVGDQGVPLSLTLTNLSDGTQAGDSFRVDAIGLTPSCGSQLVAFACPAGSQDPGVFAPSATGVGASGCAGTNFSIVLTDAVAGRYELVPSATPLNLGPTGSASATCVINLTVNVLRTPSIDASPASPGLQTAILATMSATDVTPGPNLGLTAGAAGIRTTNVLQAIPTIATLVSNSTRTLGQSFTDTAAITKPAGGPAVTGTVNFVVYGPSDATCSGPPAFSSLNRPVTSGTSTSGAFTPTSPGVYRVIATYSGDVNYAAIAGSCGDPNESVVVTQAVPTISTQVSNASITLGQSVTDFATITTPAGGPTATGTVDFRVYGPGDTACTGAPVFVSAGRAISSGTAVSATFTPISSGVYRFIATYNGDANYQPVSGACSDPSESVVVAQATPTISTQVSSASITLGQSFTDTATITKPAGAPAVTGTVNFVVYGPNDATCSGSPAMVSSGRPVGAGGTATSASFTPTAPGTYRVIATYSGDANYQPVSGVCSDPSENVVVTSTGPTVTTGAASSITATGASLAGTVNPNGMGTTYTFEYGTTLSFGSITPPTHIGFGASPVAVSANLTGLSAGTTYYYRLVATNSGLQTSTGVVRSFRTTGTAQPPFAITGAASAITTTGATLNGQVNPRGAQTSYTFEYGTSTAFGTITPVVALDDADALEPVSATLTGLAPNTTYFYRTVATNDAGTTSGPVVAFSTGPGGLPVVTTGAATGVTATGATLNGTVDANRSPTAYTFEYGTTTDFGSLSAVESAGSLSGANPFALPISGLAPNTTYLYRIVASNANGTATGQIMSFQTAAAA